MIYTRTADAPIVIWLGDVGFTAVEARVVLGITMGHLPLAPKALRLQAKEEPA